MKNINWNSVPDPVELPRLTPGGYVCKITVAEIGRASCRERV